MIAIVDYRAGNVTSVQLAFKALCAETVVTADVAVIRAASHVVFPGVGAAGSAMQNLRELGLIPVLKEVTASGVPFLGICLGTQILLSFSEEDGGTPTLDLIPGRVPRFVPTCPSDKVPQMGWNQVHFVRSHPVVNGIADNSDFYFVHSYYPAPADPAFSVGTTDYAGITFTSMMGRDNLVATQFHPEKSGRVGLKLLENFVKWDGRLV